MSNAIIELKKKEIIDCGEYIKIREYCCLFKRFILGVYVVFERYSQYSAVIKTVVDNLGVSINGFRNERDAMEFAAYIMDMCQNSTKELT